MKVKRAKLVYTVECDVCRCLW